jgi:hypothetical protein
MTAVFPALAGLPGIGLAELTEHAALLSRVDRKYVLPTVDAGALIAELAPAAVVLEIDGRRHFTYESLYFDTPELTSYRRTAHRHRRRFKIRTRVYRDSGACWLEVKVPGPRGSTVKHRWPHQAGPREVGAAGLELVGRRSRVAAARHGCGGDQEPLGRGHGRPAAVAARPPAGGDLQVRDRARRPALRPAGRAVAAAPRPAFHHRERN